MSIRALFLGLGGAALICSVTFFNDWVLRQTFLVGNHMPVSVYGGLLVFLLFNAVVIRYRQQWAFKSGELAVVLAMTLAACCIPSSGLMRTFTTTIMLPHHYAKTEGGWKSNRLTDELTAPIMLADVTKVIAQGRLAAASETTVDLGEELPSLSLGDVKVRITDADGYRQVRRLMAYDKTTRTYTLDEPWNPPDAGVEYVVLANNESESLSPFTIGNIEDPKVRWQAWWRTLLFWVPLIICFLVVVIGMAMVVHKQWSQHEQLPYPIAQFTKSLLPQEDGKASGIFSQRGFWIAAGLVCFIYINNYTQTYFPESWVQIPTKFDISPLVKLLDLRGNARWNYARPQFFFSVVAIAYFLSSEVSLSVGIAPLVYGLISAFLMTRGININEGGTRGINYQTFFLFGSYLGIACMIFYTGRQFYVNTIRQCVGLKSNESIPRYAIWGARFCAIGSFCFVLQATLTGLEWYVAFLYLAGLIMMLTVMSRILAETGMFFLQPEFVLSSILVGILGPQSIGLDSCLILFLFSAVLAFDPREALMPFVVNSAKLLDTCKVNVGKATAMTGLAVVVGLAVAIPVTLHLQHRYGGTMADTWGAGHVPKFAYKNTLHLKQRLQQQWDNVDKELVQGKGVLKARPTNWRFLIAVGIGVVAAMGFAGLRLRLNWWPLHPVLFLVATSYATAKFGPSFLAGWFIKIVVSKYGGTKVYQGLRPVMIGLIAGEIAGALIPIIISYIIYFITGEPPNSFSVFPT